MAEIRGFALDYPGKSRHERHSIRFSYIISATLLFVFLLAVPSAWAAPDTDWYTDDPTATHFTISTADELAGLAQLANSGTQNFSGKTIALANSIDLSAYDGTWVAIGSGGSYPAKNFRGTFDGAGHAISNLKGIYNAPSGGALFGDIDTSATVKNVKLTNVDISNEWQRTAALATYNEGKIENCTVDGTITSKNYQGAGLVSQNQASGIIVNCRVTGTISGTNTVGGLVAENAGTLENCVCEANISGSGDNVGGLIGNNSGTILDSVATGKVEGQADNVGGLIGKNNGSGSVKNSSATGKVDGHDNIGGLVGNNSGGTIQDSDATGKVKGYDNVGGLVGSNDGGVIADSTSGGDVTGNSNVGALAGENTGGGTITDSQVYDDVTVTDGNGTQTVGNGNIVGDNKNPDGTTGVGTTPRPTPPMPPHNPSAPSGGCDGGLSSAGAAMLAGFFMLTRRKR
jgi:hypothetical protein